MADLSEYRSRRDPTRTPEPVPQGATPAGSDGFSFVVQEHHARALHWDFRLERDGVLVSWAVPKGLPTDPAANHLAVQTEDHPLEYGTFAGTIPAGEYGGGEVLLFDHGSYVAEKWTEREIKFVLTGERVSGQYALIRTEGKNWIMHRLDAADQLPAIEPMLATPGTLPPVAEDADWAYETKWDGARAVAYLEGGRLRLLSRNDRDVTVSYPELRALAAAAGGTRLVLDGEIVAFGTAGTPSFGRLQKRMHVAKAAEATRLAGSDPVQYLIFDVLHRDGESLTARPYAERRAILAELGLSGPNWQSPPQFVGGGAAVLAANRELGLEGIVAKRLTSSYRPGRRSADWIKIKNVRDQEVLICGWKPGKGRRADTIGALLLGIPAGTGIDYIGKVGTGFTEQALSLLLARLRPLARKTAPCTGELPRADTVDAHWVRPSLVGEVSFTEWTPDGRLRHPVWRGLRPDKDAADITRVD